MTRPRAPSGPALAAVPQVVPKARLEWDDVRQRQVLLYPEGLLAPNSTGAEILSLCDGTRPLGQIVATLRQRYESATIEQEVIAFLEALAAKGLVTWRPIPST